MHLYLLYLLECSKQERGNNFFFQCLHKWLRLIYFFYDGSVLDNISIYVI